MTRPPTPTQRPDWPIPECETCVTDIADSPVSEVYDHLETDHEVLQCAAFDMVLAERTAAQLGHTQSDTTPTASDD